MTRSSLMVAKEIATALADEARRVGKPLFYLTNDIVNLYLKASEKRYDLETVLATYEYTMLIKKTGHITIPNEMYELLARKYLADNHSEIASIWRENGRRLGKYAGSMTRNPVEALRHLLSHMFWDTDFDLRFDGGEDILLISCPNHSSGREQLILNLVEGFMESCGCKIRETEVLPGLVSVKFNKIETQSPELEDRVILNSRPGSPV